MKNITIILLLLILVGTATAQSKREINISFGLSELIEDKGVEGPIDLSDRIMIVLGLGTAEMLLEDTSLFTQEVADYCVRFLETTDQDELWFDMLMQRYRYHHPRGKVRKNRLEDLWDKEVFPVLNDRETGLSHMEFLMLTNFFRFEKDVSVQDAHMWLELKDDLKPGSYTRDESYIFKLDEDE